VGKAEKGSQYMALAKLIYPELDPAAIKDQELPSAVELLAQGRAAPIGAGAESLPTGAVNSFFLRFVSALLDEDAAGVVVFLDGSTYLTKIPSEVSRSDAQAALETLFKDAPLKGKTPSDVYDLSSLMVARAPQAMQTAWGETYTLKVNAAADFSPTLSFWDMKQQFFLHRVNGTWYIFGFGQTPPPLTWTPQQAPAALAAAPVTTVSDAEISKAISDTFTACMSAILAKDADTALDHMSANIRFLRLRQTVTKEELKTSLLGYFDSTDFQQATLADVLDLDSLFVQSAASPVEGVTGAVYVLIVKSKVDLSSSIPFWSTYQKYYFSQEGTEWKVFAIL